MNKEKYDSNTDPSIKNLNKDDLENFNLNNLSSLAGEQDLIEEEKEKNSKKFKDLIHNMDDEKTLNRYKNINKKESFKDRVKNLLTKADLYLSTKNKVTSFIYCPAKAISYHLTHNMTEEYYKELYHIKDNPTAIEEKQYNQTLQQNKLSNRLKQAGIYKRGMSKALSLTLEAAKWLQEKIYYKFHGLHKRIQDYAEGKHIKNSTQNYFESKKKFLHEEKTSVLDYNKLLQMNKISEANKLLDVRIDKLKEVSKEIFNLDFVNDVSMQMYDQYKKYFNTEKITKELLDRQYKDPTYFQRLNELGDRIEASEFKSYHPDINVDKATNLETENKLKDQIGRDLLHTIGSYDERDIDVYSDFDEKETADFVQELNESAFAKTDEIDNAPLDSNDYEIGN